jgi:hypothetical protein
VTPTGRPTERIDDDIFENTLTYPLQLVKDERFKTGVLNLTYIPANS